MTSGKFKSFPISSIIVNRSERQRQELGDIASLAESIQRVGLINPIVVTRDGLLITGERRYTACKQLGHSHIAVQFQDELDALELHAIELEENVKRLNITWQEECAAILRYHNLRATFAGGEWSAAKTAEALGMSYTDVNRKLGIGDALAEGNVRVMEAPKLSTAATIVAKTQNRKKQDNLAKVADMGQALGNAPVVLVKKIPLVNAEFSLEFMARYSGPKFNFIHCDFPYGVNAGEHAMGAASTHGGYEDSAEVYWDLVRALGNLTHTICAEDAHMMFWFSMDYYTETKDALEGHGWKVNPFPLIWHKSDNKGIMPDSRRGPRRIYETAFLCTLGDRFIVDAVSNVCSHSNTKEIHMSEKPIGMLRHFFRMFIDESTVMLDPTCGSGNAVALAESMGAQFTLGIERDKEFYDAAVAAHWGAGK